GQQRHEQAHVPSPRGLQKRGGFAEPRLRSSKRGRSVAARRTALRLRGPRGAAMVRACSWFGPARGPHMIVPAEGQFRLDREADTERLGAAIARELKRREAVCLSGPLGAGKSSLARALIRTLTGEATEAPSPTFTLVQTYETKAFPLAHFDLYRLDKPEEAAE